MVFFKQMNKQSVVIFLLLLITVSAVCVTVWALFFRTTDGILAPDQAPVAQESHAQPIPGDTEKGASAEPGSGSVSLSYSNQVNIYLGSKTAKLMFTNPGRSNQDVVLQLVIQDRVILQSGRITPGNQVTRLDLPKESAAILMAGGYDGNFLIHFYDPNSGEKSIVTTALPVSVIVAE